MPPKTQSIAEPYYVLEAQLQLTANNGRRIPFSPRLISALQTALPAWTKVSNSIMSIDIGMNGADPALEEDRFISTTQQIIAQGGVTDGIKGVKVTFSCNTVVVL